MKLSGLHYEHITIGKSSILAPEASKGPDPGGDLAVAPATLRLLHISEVFAIIGLTKVDNFIMSPAQADTTRRFDDRTDGVAKTEGSRTG